jgi:hypothetical protein
VAADTGWALPDLQGAHRGIADTEVKNRQKVKTFNVEAANGRLHTQPEATVGIIAKAGGDYENHPEGQYRAICMDVVDLGLVENKQFGKMQHKVAVVFHTEAKMKDGRPFEQWERFTLSLDERARLRSFLQSWRGRAFTEQELAGFDLEKLIGVQAYLQIIHNQSNGKTYANVSTVMLPPRGAAKLEPTAGYERRKDRKPEVSKTPEPAMAQSVPAGRGYDELPAALQDEDDDLPF